jgi:Ca-activated chloride channel family protein
MRRAVSSRLLAIFVVACAALVAVGTSIRAQAPAAAQAPSASQNSTPQIPTVYTPPLPPPPDSGSQEQKGSTIKSTVQMVVLHITVTDDRGTAVDNLSGKNFRVFEDKTEQKVSLFSHDDIPLTMGLVVDNSGSMREKRRQVSAAAMTFVKTSNPQDEAFVVNFNDEYYLDTDGEFTNDQQNMSDALSRIDSRGSTALYDAVIGSLNHLKKGHKDRRVLLLVTDGEDTASRSTFTDAIKSAEKSNATIYAIGVFSADDRKNDKKMIRNSTRVLEQLTEATGGRAFFPETLDEVTPLCQQVAKEIRDQYTIGYYPSNVATDGSFRAVHVDVAAAGHGKVTARTRTGYYAQSGPASGN